MPGLLDPLASQYGLSPALLERIVQIESGGNPGARTGSYHGLFQLSNQEFNKYGGGNIYNPNDNARAGVAKLAAERDAFVQKYGREPEPYEHYLIHQQGEGGFAAHYANPDQPAWQSMASTGEGRQKGADWAKAAIWGNVPDSLKAQYGNVDNITSQQFMDLWKNKVQGGQPEVTASGSPPGMPVQAGEQSQGIPLPTPQNNPSVDALMAQRRPQYADAGAGLSALGNQLLNPGFQAAPMMQFAPLQRRPLLSIPQQQAPYGIRGLA